MFTTRPFAHRSAMYQFRDDASGLNARIALYGALNRPGLGGIRILPYASDAEADADAERLAFAMARKAAALNLPYCGGKTVLRGDPSRIKSPALWKALGEAINSLKGVYIGGEDVNMRLADIATLSRETRHVVGTPDGCGNPAPYTALGVFRAMKAAALHRYGSTVLRERRVLIQGAGSVGMALAELLHGEGAVLSICDIDPRSAHALAERYAARVIDPARAIATPCEIFCPCALGPVITADKVNSITADIIVGAANNQLAETSLGRHLQARGITYVPDYLANAGGLLAGAGEHKARRGLVAFDPAAVKTEINRMFDLVAGYLKQAETLDLPVIDVCETFVSNRLEDGIAASEAAAEKSSSLVPQGPHGWLPL